MDKGLKEVFMKKLLVLVLVVISVFAFAACGLNKDNSPEVTDEVKELVTDSLDGMVGVKYTPVAYLGTDDGDHVILCEEEAVVPEPNPTYTILIIEDEFLGKPDISDLYYSDTTIPLTLRDGSLEGWKKTDSPVITKDAKMAIKSALEEGLTGSCQPIGLLATQKLSGTNYAVICRLKTFGTKYSILNIHQDVDGKAKITDTFDFYEVEL